MTERRRLILLAAALIVGAVAAGLSRADTPAVALYDHPDCGLPEIRLEKIERNLWEPFEPDQYPVECVGFVTEFAGYVQSQAWWPNCTASSPKSKPLAVPEPSLWLGLAVGVVGLAARFGR